MTTTNASTQQELRAALERLIRRGDLPYGSMSAAVRRRLIKDGYALDELRFDGYVSIAPRFAGGLDVASVYP